MLKFWTTLDPHRRQLAVAAAVLAAALLAWWLPRFLVKADARITTPRLALESLTSTVLYFNGPALPWLVAQRPELLQPEDRDPRSDRARAFVQAVLNPKLFRQLDRRYRFDTLFLAGDPTQYRTLLEHLLETKDFTLTYVDHTSLVFKRNAPQAWSPEALRPVRARLTGVSKHDEAAFLALTGTKLVSARRAAEGKALLEEAIAIDPGVAEAWSGLAIEHMNRGAWGDALAAADQALAIDKQHLGALATKTQVFYATKHFNEAYALSRQLIERLPNDPNVLFKHAQIAHEAHAYKTEIEALEKLITLAEAEQRATTGYRLYLAQAYTAAGNGPPAIENFTRVLADPELPADQRKFAEESIQRIKSRIGQ
ncbi:MAG: hypothetical protein QOE70_1217 [Chthoniobacter sp.]|jgi:tetratricopeptide (TPR) repeat protein|nr:hypothetical protein [Chthoniobacter sp.]